MVFIETAVFTRQVQEMLSEENYGKFQQYLALNPTAGAVIEGTGGLRKMRWAVPGGGKRGGVRVIYFHVAANAQCRMILIYRKGDLDDLTASQKKQLRAINENW